MGEREIASRAVSDPIRRRSYGARAACATRTIICSCTEARYSTSLPVNGSRFDGCQPAIRQRHRPAADALTSPYRHKHLNGVSVPEILTAQIPETMAGSAEPDSCRCAVSSRATGSRSNSREWEENVYGNRERRDLRLLLAAAVPQERIAALTGVSVRTVRRIVREPAGPAPPQGLSGPASRRRGGEVGGRVAVEESESATPEASRRCMPWPGGCDRGPCARFAASRACGASSASTSSGRCNWNGREEVVRRWCFSPRV